jgi:hypothetical protein
MLLINGHRFLELETIQILNKAIKFLNLIKKDLDLQLLKLHALKILLFVRILLVNTTTILMVAGLDPSLLQEGVLDLEDTTF